MVYGLLAMLLQAARQSLAGRRVFVVWTEDGWRVL